MGEADIQVTPQQERDPGRLLPQEIEEAVQVSPDALSCRVPILIQNEAAPAELCSGGQDPPGSLP